MIRARTEIPERATVTRGLATCARKSAKAHDARPRALAAPAGEKRTRDRRNYPGVTSRQSKSASSGAASVAATS